LKKKQKGPLTLKRIEKFKAKVMCVWLSRQSGTYTVCRANMAHIRQSRPRWRAVGEEDSASEKKGSTFSGLKKKQKGPLTLKRIEKFKAKMITFWPWISGRRG